MTSWATHSTSLRANKACTAWRPTKIRAGTNGDCRTGCIQLTKKAETAVAAVAVDLLRGENESVCLVTIDIDLGETGLFVLEATKFKNLTLPKMGSS